MNIKLITILIFLFSYMGIIWKKDYKEWIVILASILLIILNIITFKNAVSFINMRVINIFVGTYFVAEVFTLSNVPMYIADKLVNRSKNIGIAMLYVTIVTGILSSFLENVTTVLIMAPIALSIAKKQNINPTVLLIGLAISSNLQGVATLIGDSPSIILGSFADMGFNDFFIFKGRLSLFFIVELGAIVSFAYLYMYFRKYKQNIKKIEPPKINDWIPTIILCMMVTVLIIVSFIYKENKDILGYICLFFGFLAFLWEVVIRKSIEVKEFVRRFDFNTLFFLIGIFVLVGSLTKTGIVHDVGNFMSGFMKDNYFMAFNVIGWSSVLFSAIIDNIPYVMTLLPAVKTFTENISTAPYIFYFALLIGASVGGNITPIGAAANIVTMGILKNKGYHVKFIDFVKIGLPFTVLATGTSFLFLWIFWKTSI